MNRILVLPAVLAALIATPVAAAPFCGDGTANANVSVHFTFGFRLGDEYSEAEIAEFDRLNLRRQGYDVSRAERWNGCIRAWVREDGAEKMRFFDPDTLEEVD